MSFLAMFRAAVRQWPERPAIRRDARAVSFLELDEASAGVAAALVARGIGRGHRVAVCLDHEVPLIETILGVMRAGAAFVPIDRRHTDARVRQVLSTARVHLAVAETGHVLDDVSVVDPATLRAEGGRPLTPAAEPAPGDTAYVLFTSGSTGEPKGVVVSHGALANYVRWAADSLLRFGIGGAPMYTSIAFDATITAMFSPLAAGRPVHLVPAPDGVFGVVDLLAEGVNFDFVKATPSHLRMMLAALVDTPMTGRVACLLLGGEAVTADVVRDWRALSPDTVVINHYGPTEATVGCCVNEIGADEPVPDEIPIGRAIPSVALHVLDEQGRPTEPDEVGELYIGGGLLADGYFGQPVLTAARFVADPFAASAVGRLYRTGDLVRRRADGRLCYHGRNDDQVKIRGHRVEPSEIAGVIRGHPDVRDCVIRAWHRDVDDVRLVAYIVPRPGAAMPLAADLRAFLRERLPEYLVPYHLVPMAEIPHNINGKVDVARLPDPATVG
jgi:amino acid adenylation domain-containing protein